MLGWIVGALLSALPAAAAELPAIIAAPSGERHTGKVVWWDLLTETADCAEAFYGALFGWRFERTAGADDYALARLDGRAGPDGRGARQRWRVARAPRERGRRSAG